MELKSVIILDDITALSEFIESKIRKECGKDIEVDSFSTEQDFVIRLNKSQPETTLIMINAAFKPSSQGTHRYEFNGISRILKLCLRIIWQKLHPVVVYGTIPEEGLLNLPQGNIFTLNQNHKYLDLTKIKDTSLKDLFLQINPIADNDKLKSIIITQCSAELIKHIEVSINHLLGKTRWLYEESWRTKFLNCLRELDELFHDDQINKLRIRSTIRHLKSFEEGNLNLIKDSIKFIQDELSELKKKIEQRSKINVYPQSTVY